MTILVMSDLHYEKDFHHRVWEGDTFKWVMTVLDYHRPWHLVLCGDSGYAWDEEEWETLLGKVKVTAIYGNHDNVQMLKGLRNLDRSKVWMRDGETRMLMGFKFGFINGIIGGEKEKRRRRTYRERYGDSITDITYVPRLLPEEYLAAADRLAEQKIDVLVTHASLPLPTDGRKFSPTPEFETIDEAIGRIKPHIAFNGHLSGPYAIWQTQYKLTIVRVDSSPQEKHYALLESGKIRIYHDMDKVQEVVY